MAIINPKPTVIYCVNCRRKFANLGSDQTCDECTAEFDGYVPKIGVATVLATVLATVPTGTAIAGIALVDPDTQERLEYIFDVDAYNRIRMYGFFVPFSPSNVLKFYRCTSDEDKWVVKVIFIEQVREALLESQMNPTWVADNTLYSHHAHLVGVNGTVTEVRFGTIEVMQSFHIVPRNTIHPTELNYIVDDPL